MKSVSAPDPEHPSHPLGGKSPVSSKARVGEQIDVVSKPVKLVPSRVSFVDVGVWTSLAKVSEMPKPTSSSSTIRMFGALAGNHCRTAGLIHLRESGPTLELVGPHKRSPDPHFTSPISLGRHDLSKKGSIGLYKRRMVNQPFFGSV